MPIIEVSDYKHEDCPVGTHKCWLDEVEVVQQDDFKDKTKKVDRWVWRFYTEEENPESGNSYECFMWTGTIYGNAKAGLTRMLNSIIPNCDEEKAKGLNTDTLLTKNSGVWFNVTVVNEANDKGEMRPKAVAVLPIRKKAKPTPVVDDEADTPAPAPKKPKPASVVDPYENE